jgi:nucleoside phosphorylase
MIHYVILSAVPNEAAFFLTHYPIISTGHLGRLPYSVVMIGDHPTAIIVGGIGTSFTASAATAAFFELKPQAIFFSGAAGAIASDQSIGDIVIANHAYEPEIQGLTRLLDDINFASDVAHPVSGVMQPLAFDADPQLLKQAKHHCQQYPATIGTVVSSNLFPSPPSLFQQLKQDGVLAIDMETSALYQVGWLYQIPTLAFRCISNLLTDDGAYLEHDEPYHEAEYAASEYTAAFIKQLQYV